MSFSFNTCAREVRFSLNADPYTFYFLEVDCKDIADLTDATVRRDLGVDIVDLECPNWEAEMYAGKVPATHAVADRLIKAGYAGIKVQSFARDANPEDVNLILWTWDDVTESGANSAHTVRVLKREELPRNNLSWPR